MSSNTKIVVLRSKELVYALVFLVVSVLIIMAAMSLFMPSKEHTAAPAAPARNAGKTTGKTILQDNAATDVLDLYVPGIYSSTLLLGNSHVELQVAVDKDHINSISLANIDESVETLYPLMAPTLASLEDTILERQNVDNLGYSTENRYTSMLLIQAITATLDKARIPEEKDRPEGSGASAY